MNYSPDEIRQILEDMDPIDIDLRGHSIESHELTIPIGPLTLAIDLTITVDNSGVFMIPYIDEGHMNYEGVGRPVFFYEFNYIHLFFEDDDLLDRWNWHEAKMILEKKINIYT